jgi:TPR repeat protein
MTFSLSLTLSFMNGIVRKGFVTRVLGCLTLSSMAFNVQADLYDDGLMAYTMGHYTQAGQLFIDAAEAGNPGAEHMLMRLFSEGRLYAENPGQEIMKWTRKAAEQGVMQAQLALGHLYANQQDNKAAVEWYRKAADQGHPEAFYRLGAIFEKGAEGVRADADESQHLYQIAASEFDVFAQKGDAESQYLLAGMYQTARGVKKNLAQALKWGEKSALQGHALAQLSLGRLYAQGRNTPRDTRLAVYWLGLAAAQGIGEAVVLLATLKKERDAAVALVL